MKGKYRIKIYDRFVSYDFEIKRNITIIRGDSGTGKTSLIKLLLEHQDHPENVAFIGDCETLVITGETSWEMFKRDAKSENPKYSKRIVFIDEGYRFVDKCLFYEYDNYFVLISRKDTNKKLSQLSYSIEEIYEIVSSGKYNTTSPVYNELVPMYKSSPNDNPDLLILEDEASGFQFFESVFPNCESAKGNSNVVTKLEDVSKDKNILAIVDGAAYGPYASDLFTYISKYKNINVYLPESFEWIILKSGVIEDIPNIEEKLNCTYNYADSLEYNSWEDYYFKLLEYETLNDRRKQYNKHKLKEFYTSKGIKELILDVLPFRLTNIY